MHKILNLCNFPRTGKTESSWYNYNSPLVLTRFSALKYVNTLGCFLGAKRGGWAHDFEGVRCVRVRSLYHVSTGAKIAYSISPLLSLYVVSLCPVVIFDTGTTGKVTRETEHGSGENAYGTRKRAKIRGAGKLYGDTGKTRERRLKTRENAYILYI